MAEVARGMDGNAKLRRFPQGGRMVDKVVLVGGATRMPCVQVGRRQERCWPVLGGHGAYFTGTPCGFLRDAVCFRVKPTLLLVFFPRVHKPGKGVGGVDVSAARRVSR